MQKNFSYPPNSTAEIENLQHIAVDSKVLPRKLPEAIPRLSAGEFVDLLSCPVETAESLAGWEFLLAEAITHAPWSREASIWVDRAIALREGGAAW